MLLNAKKETRVKFNPGLSANWPSNNWAQMFVAFNSENVFVLNRGEFWYVI